MVNYCCVCKLEAGQENDISFHRLPKDEKIRANWFAFIGRETTLNIHVCSKHFTQFDFIYKLRGQNVRRFLKEGACPSILQTPQNRENADIILENKNINISTSSKAKSNTNPKTNYITSDNESQDHIIDEEYIKVETTISTNSSIDTQLKRETDDYSVCITKRNRTIRYPGDLRREDFNSDKAWCLFTDFKTTADEKIRFLNRKVNHLNKKMKSMQKIINHLKEILSNNTIRVRKSCSRKRENKKVSKRDVRKNINIAKRRSIVMSC